VAASDIVVANLPRATLAALGLDYESVSAVNPRAILAVVSAFGLEGPYADRVGFDGVAQACAARRGFGNRNQPVRAAAPWVDFGTASLLALGVVAALRERERSGRGQLVEGALLRTAMSFFSPMLIEESLLKLARQPTLNRSQTAAPSDIYRTRDGWVTIAVNGDPLFRRVAKLIGAPEWIEGPALCERQIAWRSRRDRQRAHFGMVRATHRVRSDLCMRNRACARRSRLSDA